MKDSVPVPMEMKPAGRWSTKEIPQNKRELLRTDSTKKTQTKTKRVNWISLFG
jgi:hypothetical protein